MKKWTSLILMLFLAFSFFTGCGPKDAPKEVKEPEIASPKTTFRIASLKGPTTMGMVQLMQKQEESKTLHNYQVDMYGTADEFVPKLVKGEIDVALVPCNLASVLYNKTQGELQVAAINTLGVLYIVESGNTVQSMEDLRGRTIYSTGKGTTPEYALRYLLEQNGIDPDKDVTIEYKSESTELAVMLADSENTVAVLPQPYVTVVQMQNDKVRIALDMTKEWDKVSSDSGMVTGVLLVRKGFVEENPVAFTEFLNEYQASTEFVNNNVEEAAALVEKYGIVAKAPIAVKAIPQCNITYIEGKSMREKVSGYLKVLFDANPQSIGGALPGDDFYYQR
ncbi:MAG: ABC transporter substrate-binding protein [Peptococcales bacterium]|jgi:NitT/TauT family transport system substrate-binding protein